MKTRKLLSGVLACTLAVTSSALLTVPASAEEGDVAINETNFPDEALRDHLLNGYDYKDKNTQEIKHFYFDANKDKILQDSELQEITDLDLSDVPVSDLTGLNKLKYLEGLYIYNTQVTSVKSKDFPAGLRYIEICENEELTSVEFTNYEGHYDEVEEEIEIEEGQTETITVKSYEFYINTWGNPKLEKVSITGCKGICVVGIEETGVKEFTLKNNVFNKEDNDFYFNSPESDVKYTIGKNENLTNIYISSIISTVDLSALTDLEWIEIENTNGYFDYKTAIVLPDGYDDDNIGINFTSYLGNVASLDLSTVENFDISKASNWRDGTVSENILTPAKSDPKTPVHVHCNYKLSNTLEAWWTFVFDPNKPAVNSNVVWVNGKDNKDKNDESKSEYYKTFSYQVEGKYSGGKWCVAVTPSTISKADDFVALFENGKAKADKKEVFANAKKCASAKLKEGVVTVTAGKEAGKVNVWVYEVKKDAASKKNIIVNSDGIAPMMKTVDVLMAAGSPVFTDSATKPTDKVAQGVSKFDLESGASKKLFIADKKGVLDAGAKFTVEVDDSGKSAVEITKSTNGQEITVKHKAAGKATITVTCVQTGKKAKLTVTCK